MEYVRAAVLFLSLLPSSSAYDEVLDFCNRWDHQSVVKNNRLYIDGGNQVYKSPTDNGLPYVIGVNRKLISVDLTSSWDWKTNISIVAIDKTANPNTGTEPPNMIQGGMYMGTDSDPNVYVFGGAKSQLNTSFAYSVPDPSTYALWSFDTNTQSWNQYDITSGVSLRPSRGAYVEAPDQGLAFYLNGKSSFGSSSSTADMGSKVAGMKGLVVLNTTDIAPYARNVSFSAFGTDAAKAGSELVYVPQIGSRGILVDLGGVLLSTTAASQNGTMVPLDSVNVLDVATLFGGDGVWYKQPTSGIVPPPRADSCTVVAPAPDGSSYNIYLYAGRDPTSDTYYDDIYVLSLPSFTWTKLYSGDSPRWGHTCHLVGKGGRQIITVGGISSRNWTEKCDWETKSVAIMDISTKKWGSVFNAFAAPYQVTPDLLPVIGGTIDGGATMLEPRGGFADLNLKNVFSTKRGSTDSAPPIDTPTSSPALPAPPQRSTTPVGAIAGGVVGGVIGLFLVAAAVIFVLRRKRRSAMGSASDDPPAYHEKRGQQDRFHELGAGDRVAAVELPGKHAHEMPAVVPVYELSEETSNGR